MIREEPRRAGDPAYLVARAERIRTELGWQPRYDDLRAIVSSSPARGSRSCSASPGSDEVRGVRKLLSSVRRPRLYLPPQNATLTPSFLC